MTDLKKELYFYSGSRLYAPMTEALKGKEALEAFFISGKIYLSNACDHPHVFRFLNVDDPMDTIGDDVAEGRNSSLTRMFSSSFQRNTMYPRNSSEKR